MNKNLFSIVLFIIAIFAFNTYSIAQNKLIHYWHFNNYIVSDSSSPTHTIAPIPADYSTLGAANMLYAKLPSASIYYKTHIDSIIVQPTDYDTINARMSQPEGMALRVRNPSDSMRLLLYMPTTNYQNIKLTYATQSSSVTKGQLHQLFDYSTDSGMTWITTGLSMPSDSAWLIYHRTTVTFTTATAVNNNPKLVFRITFNGNDTGVKGNNRFDNVTVEGDTVASGTGIASLNEDIHYTLYPNPAGNSLSITAEKEGVKNVAVFNVEGKEILTNIVSGKQFNVDVSSLPGGVYFIKISDANTGTSKDIQFIKQ